MRIITQRYPSEYVFFLKKTAKKTAAVKVFFLSTHPVISFTAPVLASLFDPLLRKAAEDDRGGVVPDREMRGRWRESDWAGAFITSR